MVDDATSLADSQDDDVEEGEEGDKMPDMEPGSFFNDSDDPSDDSSGSDNGEGETIDELMQRGMPNYESWSLADLKHTVSQFGFRKGARKSVLVKQLQQCWVMLNPRGGSPAPSVGDSPPLQRSRRHSSASRTSPRNALADSDTDERDEAHEARLFATFNDMLVTDTEVYSRLLRYEPLPWDELVSMGNARTDLPRGWRPYLRRFLDRQCITFYTSDPTAPRARR